MTVTKHWYKSKVVWFNALVAIGTALEASMHIVADYFDPRVYFALIGLIAGVNVVLRFVSTQGITK